MATTIYKPLHETTETTNNGKVTGTIRGSYLMYADQHTKVFMNNVEKIRSIYSKVSGNDQRQVIVACQLLFTFGN